jgi:hypothetical protein
MPQRIVRRRRFEIEAERTPVTPATHRRMLRLARADAPKALAAWTSAVDPDDRFCAAPRAVVAALILDQAEEAVQMATSAIELAALYRGHWNHDNVIHRANTVLGIVALRAHDVQRAVDHLHRSAAVEGSPQLKSFGPSMWLARDLLRAGEVQVVLSYFRQCGLFWPHGREWLRIWDLKVRRGAMPSFVMHLYG